MRVEACGICPTDVRKYAIGTRDGYPAEPGPRVGRRGCGGRGRRDGWSIGQRVCGDTYAGYAEYAVLSVDPGAWSNGALAIPDDLDAVRATFVEPLADCVHAVRDQARVRTGSRVCIVGAGQMGLQMVGRRRRRRRGGHGGRAPRRSGARSRGSSGPPTMADGPELVRGRVAAARR